MALPEVRASFENNRFGRCGGFVVDVFQKRRFTPKPARKSSEGEGKARAHAAAVAALEASEEAEVEGSVTTEGKHAALGVGILSFVKFDYFWMKSSPKI